MTPQQKLQPDDKVIWELTARASINNQGVVGHYTLSASDPNNPINYGTVSLQYKNAAGVFEDRVLSLLSLVDPPLKTYEGDVEDRTSALTEPRTFMVSAIVGIGTVFYGPYQKEFTISPE